MKKLVWILLILACAALLIFSDAAMETASNALDLWWTRVLPSLLPFYVLISYMMRTGILDYFYHWARGALPICFLFGMIAGFPTGARLAVASQTEELAPFCNLCSPMFLLSVVSAGMFHNRNIFLPLAISHYGSALLLAICNMILPKRKNRWNASTVTMGSQQGSIVRDIGDGMQAMLGIGGCILFFNVMFGVAEQAFRLQKFPLLCAVITGLGEITSGCAKLSALTIPLRLQISILAAILSFGGFCVFAQAMIVASFKNPLHYLLGKVSHACLAFLLSFFLTPLFLPESIETFSGPMQTYTENAVSMLALVFAACIGLLSSYLTAIGMKNSRSMHTSGE